MVRRSTYAPFLQLFCKSINKFKKLHFGHFGKNLSAGRWRQSKTRQLSCASLPTTCRYTLSTLPHLAGLGQMQGSSPRTSRMVFGGVIPIHFDPKYVQILVKHLSTKFYQFPTLKTLWNRLRHTSTSLTSLRTSWMFPDVLTLKLSKWLINIFFYLKTVLWLLETHVRL